MRTIQQPLFTPETEWVMPEELKDLKGVKEIAVDLETNDPNLKELGSGNTNYLSFPGKGYTLTLDLKMNKVLKSIYQEFELLLEKYNTKVYLTKDSFMSEKYFKNTYKNSNKFKEIKKKHDPLNLITSFQSKRLGF